MAGTVKLVVHDAVGREIESIVFPVEKGTGGYHWRPTGLTPGVYFLHLSGAGMDLTARALLLD